VLAVSDRVSWSGNHVLVPWWIMGWEKAAQTADFVFVLDENTGEYLPGDGTPRDKKAFAQLKVDYKTWKSSDGYASYLTVTTSVECGYAGSITSNSGFTGSVQCARRWW
jgi:hypothetical protein